MKRLSKIAALKVISRTSTGEYKSAPDNLREVGNQLGVANLLEGSVQKIANAVHINVQLIRAATDEHLWAESYNRKLDDVFAVEGEVAKAIADQLEAKLTGAEQRAVTAKPTQNTAAYDAYLRGQSLEHGEYSYDAVRQAARDYAEAFELDPRDVTLLNDMGLTFYVYLRRFDDAHALVDQALEIAPDSVTVRANKTALFQAEGRLEEARRELARISENASDDWVIGARIQQAIYERDYDNAIKVIEAKLNSIPANQRLDSFTKQFLV